jgi:hypothetical protein
MKLKVPVENFHKAFCTPGCHASFYLKRCLICERPIIKKSSKRELCDKSKCRSALQSNQYRFRYPHSGQALIRSRKPHKMGTETGTQKRPTTLFANAPLNIVGGGSWRWPNTPHLDANTLEKIRIREIAGLTEVRDYDVPEAA